MTIKKYSAVVIGGSAGSLDVLLQIISCLPKQLCLPLVIINHLHPQDEGGVVAFLSQLTHHRVQEAGDKEPVQAGIIYCPAADYHLLVNSNRTFSLSLDPKVNFSRPSIDVLFESAAPVWGEELVGIILTGANCDGAEGIRSIKKHGGLTIAQDPSGAAFPVMVRAAIDTGHVDKILSIAEILEFLQEITGRYGSTIDRG